MRAAIALTLMIGWTVPAYADKSVGVIAIGEGMIPPQVSALIEGWLTQHGRVVVSSPLPPAAISEIFNCFALAHADCARDIVDTQAKSNTVVYVQVEAKHGTRDFTLTLHWFDKGHDAIVEHGLCERCTNASLSAATEGLMTKLAHAVASAMGHIRLTSSPPGARITLDGEPVGVTPLDWDVPMGKHTIAMQLDHHEPQKRTVTVHTDRTEVVDMSLTATAIKNQAPGDRGDSLGPSRVLPLTAMAIGTAAIIAGGVMIAIDREEAPYAPPTIHNSAPAGVGISIAGAVVAGVGAYLWVRTPEVRSSPVAIVTSDTAYLGWLGRF